MTDSERIHYEKEIKQRLEKYDVLKQSTKQNIDKAFKESVENIYQEVIKESNVQSKEQIAVWIFQILFNAQSKQHWNMFSTISAYGYCPPQRRPIGISQELEALYSASEDNCSLLIDDTNSWWLYGKDVLRALSYREWVEQFSLKTEDIEISRPKDFDYEEYQNFPVWIGIHAENAQNKIAYISLSICGGLLGKELQSEKKKYLLGLFKREKVENDTLRYAKKEKGIPFSSLARFLKEPKTEELSPADIWFLKNVFDPELTVSIGSMLGERSITDEDRKMIELLSQCRPVSVRLYLFEAVKAMYRYTGDHLKEGRKAAHKKDIYEEMGQLLSDTIDEVNSMFGDLTAKVEFILKHIGVSAERVYMHSEGLKNSFLRGDDFPFTINTGFTLPPKVQDSLAGCVVAKRPGDPVVSEETSEMKTTQQEQTKVENKYAKFVAESARKKTLSKILYLVVTNLNEAWKQDYLKASRKQRKDYEEAWNFTLSFKDRLVSFLNQK